MTRLPMVNEIAFIDPAVADIPVLIAGLRPGVLPVLLGAAMPAVEQIARAVRGREGLDAIHVFVHGGSGELGFSAGPLLRANIGTYADDLAVIGDALGPDGDLLLWSCRAGEGARGQAFLQALSRAAGAPVGGRDGPGRRRGAWRRLGTRARRGSSPHSGPLAAHRCRYGRVSRGDV